MKQEVKGTVSTGKRKGKFKILEQQLRVLLLEDSEPDSNGRSTTRWLRYLINPLSTIEIYNLEGQRLVRCTKVINCSKNERGFLHPKKKTHTSLKRVGNNLNKNPYTVK